jgi:hypothetical protein
MAIDWDDEEGFVPVGEAVVTDWDDDEGFQDITTSGPQNWEFNKEKYLREMAQEQNPLEAALISAGREVSKMGAGAADLYDKYISGDTESMEVRAGEQAVADEAFDVLGDEQPLATIGGSIVPYLVPGLGTTAALKNIGTASKVLSKFQKARGALPAIARAGSSGALGAAEGALAGGLHYDQTAAEGAAWGAGGRLAGDLLGKAFTTGKGVWNDAQREVVDWAKSKGMVLPPGVREGLPSIHQMYNRIRSTGSGSNVLARYVRNNTEAANRAITEELGDPVTDISQEYLEGTQHRIEQEMNTLFGNLDPIKMKAKEALEYFRPLIGVVKQEKMVPESSESLKAMKDILQRNVVKKFKSGEMSGDSYRQALKDLEFSKKDFEGNAEVKQFIDYVKDELFDMMSELNPNVGSATSPATLKSAGDMLNMQYRIVKDLKKTVKHGNARPMKMSTKFSPAITNLQDLAGMQTELRATGLNNPIKNALVQAVDFIPDASGGLAQAHMRRPRFGPGVRSAWGDLGAATGIATGTNWDDALD